VGYEKQLGIFMKALIKWQIKQSSENLDKAIDFVLNRSLIVGNFNGVFPLMDQNKDLVGYLANDKDFITIEIYR
jgi:hypothetical protein